MAQIDLKFMQGNRATAKQMDMFAYANKKHVDTAKKVKPVKVREGK